MTWTIDDIHIAPIVDADCFEIDLDRLFPLSDARALAGHDWLDPHHVDLARARVKLGMHSFLIRTPQLNVLVDTCIGAHKQRPAHPAWHARATTRFIDDLRAQGLGVADIDLVFCTHLHADHIGWNTMLEDGRWVPTFPNARYVLSEIELDYWLDRASGGVRINHGSLDDSLLPVLDSGQAMLSGAGDVLAPGLTLVALAGHTIDHLGLELRRPGGRALFCGDAIHSPAQLVRPDWASAFCQDPVEAVATRTALLDRAAEEDMLLFPAHFRDEKAMRIRRNGDVYRPA
jgi:glyoxylase-like metal-dependent hydrolase (beta-lactamase superfamily II)